MNAQSTLNRAQILEALQSNTYDLTVIGGGITGAGIALDATARGLKVALIEKDDFGSGTSSKSTKLIHGGLRYLKQMEFRLVREVGQERAIVHRLAPHLVLSEKMLLPLIKGGTYGPWATSLGLKVYDLLAGVKGDDRRKMLTKQQTLEMEPLLKSDMLVGGGFYAEYRTDDARLTIENIKTAVQKGACCLNYIAAQDFVYSEDGKVTGVIANDKLRDEALTISSRYVISAAGPWVDQLRKKDKSLKGKHLFLSKGVHIVVPFERFPIQHAVYFDNADGRMVFAIPRHRATYIGTTDTPYDGPLDRIPIELEDVQYLLDAANQMFPDIKLDLEDVESSWAGLRPLIHEEGKSASQMSRKDEIFESESGLLSIAGGKLTGYRKMAERVVNRVADKYKAATGKTLLKNSTRIIPLTGGLFKNAAEVSQYQQGITNQIEHLGLLPYHAAYLVANYGRQTDTILELMKSMPGQTPSVRLAESEARFVIENELAVTALDFFNRRSGRLFFNLPSIHHVLDPVLAVFKELLEWDDQHLAVERTSVVEEMDRLSNFEAKTMASN